MADLRRPYSGRENCQDYNTGPLKTFTSVRGRMGIATAHRASPVAPKAERQDGNKEEVENVQAPGLKGPSRLPARVAEIISISDDLAPQRIDTMQNQQPLLQYCDWIVFHPDVSYTALISSKRLRFKTAIF